MVPRDDRREGARRRILHHDAGKPLVGRRDERRRDPQIHREGEKLVSARPPRHFRGLSDLAHPGDEPAAQLLRAYRQLEVRHDLGRRILQRTSDDLRHVLLGPRGAQVAHDLRFRLVPPVFGVGERAVHVEQDGTRKAAGGGIGRHVHLDLEETAFCEKAF